MDKNELEAHELSYWILRSTVETMVTEMLERGSIRKWAALEAINDGYTFALDKVKSNEEKYAAGH